MDALVRFNDERLEDGDADLILEEEARAWKYGREWLRTQAAPHLDGLKEHVRKSVGIYREPLKCEEEKIEQVVANIFRA